MSNHTGIPKEPRKEWLMSKIMWPMGKDHPDCICSDMPNVNCVVHITKMTQPPSSADWLSEILDDLWIDNKTYPIFDDRARKAKLAILAKLKQVEEEKLKSGFYAGQANAGVLLEECHKNWKKWNVT